jgi:hypothetical protein
VAVLLAGAGAITAGAWDSGVTAPGTGVAGCVAWATCDSTATSWRAATSLFTKATAASTLTAVTATAAVATSGCSLAVGGVGVRAAGCIVFSIDTAYAVAVKNAGRRDAGDVQGVTSVTGCVAGRPSAAAGGA